MLMDKQAVIGYIKDMKKIYTDIHALSEKGGVGVGDSSKYLGKIQALIEFEHYVNSGRFDVDLFDSTYIINTSEPEEVVKIWFDKSKGI